MTHDLAARDRAVVAEIRASVADYEPVRGDRFAGVEASGSYPDTLVRVIFETTEGRQFREYAIWKDFDSEELDVISVRVWADIAEYF